MKKSGMFIGILVVIFATRFAQLYREQMQIEQFKQELNVWAENYEPQWKKQFEFNESLRNELIKSLREEMNK